MKRFDGVPSQVRNEATLRGLTLNESEIAQIADDVREGEGRLLDRVVAWFDAEAAHTARTTAMPALR